MGFKVEDSVGFKLGGLVGLVRVNKWVMNYVYENPWLAN